MSIHLHPLQKSDLHWWNKILEEKSLANIEHFSPMLVMGCIYSIAVLVSSDSKEK